MPDSRRHRSAGPEDVRLFSGEHAPRLAEAFTHFAWLLDHGYAVPSSLEIVGNRFDLVGRQRDALKRAGCTAAERDARAERLVAPGDLRGRPLAIDGFNVLTTVECALGGGLVLVARDGCARDLASMHGTWRRVAETAPAAEAVATYLGEVGAGPTTWYLDAPVSNSGRLAALLRDLSDARGLEWEVHVVPDPDRVLVETPSVVASADRGVLDGVASWTNLARDVVERCAPTAWVLDVSDGDGSPGGR